MGAWQPLPDGRGSVPSRARKQAVFLLAVCIPALAEVIDRVAASVDKQVITQSAIEEQIRITAFLNQEPLRLDAISRRRMAERIVEQRLIRHEMEISRYPTPDPKQADPLFEQIRKRAGTPEEFRKQLDRYRITETDLRRNLLLQLASLRFIELRFRPGSSVSDGEIELYYREQFVPEWEKKHATPPPDLDAAWERIEAELLQQRVDQALDQWLKQARAVARVRYFEEAFQ